MTEEDEIWGFRADLMLLRLFAIVPLVFLGVSLGLDFARRGHFLDSISAYYGSPVRDVFVGTLVALGVVYVIYRGVTFVEDRALDLAGFFVVIVALVPHNYETLLRTVPEPEVARGTLVWTLVSWVVISGAFWGLQVWWRQHVIPASGRQVPLWQQVLSGLPWLGFVAFAAMWVFGGGNLSVIHFVAAVLVVSCLIVVVLTHAFGPDDTRAPMANRPEVKGIQVAIAVWMLGGLGVGVVLYLGGNPFWVLITEFIEIGAFLAYWIVNLVIASLALRAEVQGRPRPNPVGAAH